MKEKNETNQLPTDTIDMQSCSYVPVTSPPVTGLYVTSEDDERGTLLELETPMPQHIYAKINDNIAYALTRGDRITQFGLFSQMETEDGIRSADYVVRDGQWVREESFDPFEGVEEIDDA